MKGDSTVISDEMVFENPENVRLKVGGTEWF